MGEESWERGTEGSFGIVWVGEWDVVSGSLGGMLVLWLFGLGGRGRLLDEVKDGVGEMSCQGVHRCRWHGRPRKRPTAGWLNAFGTEWLHTWTLLSGSLFIVR